MQTCWFIVIEAMGAWWVDCEGKPYGPFESSAQAASEAERIALAYGDEKRRSEVFVTQPDGNHKLVWVGPEPVAQRWSL